MNSTVIHQTAIVSEKAQLGENVRIGPYSIIEEDVEIGDNCEIRSGVYIDNGTRIGRDCRICKGVVIGTEPQDLKYADEKTLTFVGERTTLREYVTINRGTKETKKTVVGSDCLIMTYSHVAHDCRVGNNVIISNTTQLAGHVTIEDWVNIGGVVKIHQFCKVGCHSFIGADVKIVKEVPPYTLIGREPAKVEGLNIIGLRRRGFSNELIGEIQKFYELVLFSGLNTRDGIAKYLENNSPCEEIKHCIDFIESSGRGIYRN
ncbi:MAG: Acyl-ACP--UDP-N-acetylglucosamine O-acyltransferase [Bacteroidota bacterium]|nr:Acyl-ACP--UDP-N-acetylglucosamine O-acyltransferase [Bacteroidota bacterium]